MCPIVHQNADKVNRKIEIGLQKDHIIFHIVYRSDGHDFPEIILLEMRYIEKYDKIILCKYNMHWILHIIAENAKKI